jgi:hypothetical protein
MMASEQIAATPFGVAQALTELSADFEMVEVEHGLISVAIMTRVLLDQQSPRPLEARAPCGVLIPDTAQSSVTKPLTIREACNKVVHATNRNFDVDNRHTPTGLKPVMHLYGAQFNREWKASLDILVFAAEIADLTRGVSVGVPQ